MEAATKPTVVHNQLPPAYSSWLEFYDDLPANLRDEPVTKTLIEGREGFSRSHFTEYEVRREYLLARLAEELLPTRLLRQEVRELEHLHRVALNYSNGITESDMKSVFARLHVGAERRRL